MYFYKLTRDGKTVFATKSDNPIPNPNYEEISREEYEAFTGDVEPEPTLDEIRAAKLEELSAACGEVITAGFDIELDGKMEHFDLRVEDQNNIDSLFDLVKLGGTEFPYQADGGRCRFYTAQEILQIYIKSKTSITAQTTYHNALKEYVQGLDDAETIAAVQYGMDLPEPFASKVADTLARASAQMSAVLAAIGGDTNAV